MKFIDDNLQALNGENLLELAEPPNTLPQWPSLLQLGLSETERMERSCAIGGSDANIILSGSRDRILDLWREKRGEQPSADLSDRLPVMLGNWTEQFNRQWYEKTTGFEVSRVGLSVKCDTYDWRRCTLDGYLEPENCVWEAKHTSAFSKSEEVVERYMPQLQHNMAVTRAESAVLSVIFGNHKFEVFHVAADWLYQLDLLEAERLFWECVATGVEPVIAPAPPVPRAFGTRQISFEGNNAWASAALDWLETKKPAKINAAASSTIKSLIEDDVSRAFGHGIEVKRSKSGAMTIREQAA